jgi:glucose-6-phosphate-specific signal transduction histidine kinase
LRALGTRLVRAQEDEQRRIAQELQGELEQGMTALGTRLALLARTSLEPAQMAAVDSLRSLSQDIQASMRDVLVHLRPAVLDRHGLEQALRSGPIRDLLADAGVDYRIVLRGPLASIDLDTQGALYRICQEAAIDCVRRQRGRRFELDLEADGEGADALAIGLWIECDADPAHARGAGLTESGLPGTRDRVIALGGTYEFRHDGLRVRHHVAVRAARRDEGAAH